MYCQLPYLYPFPLPETKLTHPLLSCVSHFNWGHLFIFYTACIQCAWACYYWGCRSWSLTRFLCTICPHSVSGTTHPWKFLQGFPTTDPAGYLVRVPISPSLTSGIQRRIKVPSATYSSPFGRISRLGQDRLLSSEFDNFPSHAHLHSLLPSSVEKSDTAYAWRYIRHLLTLASVFLMSISTNISVRNLSISVCNGDPLNTSFSPFAREKFIKVCAFLKSFAFLRGCIWPSKHLYSLAHHIAPKKDISLCQSINILSEMRNLSSFLWIKHILIGEDEVLALLKAKRAGNPLQILLLAGEDLRWRHAPVWRNNNVSDTHHWQPWCPTFTCHTWWWSPQALPPTWAPLPRPPHPVSLAGPTFLLGIIDRIFAFRVWRPPGFWWSEPTGWHRQAERMGSDNDEDWDSGKLSPAAVVNLLGSVWSTALYNGSQGQERIFITLVSQQGSFSLVTVKS